MNRGDAELIVRLKSQRDRLRRAIELALPLVAELAEGESYYGNPVDPDPRLFTPDPESSTEEERALHQRLCESWDRGECEPIPTTHRNITLPNGDAAHVDLQPLGLGVGRVRNELAEQALAELRNALTETADP